MFTPEAKQLGVLHWHFLRAVVAEEAQHPERPGTLDLNAILSAGGFRACDIPWWVHTQETDRAELLRRVAELLVPARRLEKAAERLARRAAAASDDIVAMANNFAFAHRDDIAPILAFVQWLADRNVLAPGILFHGAVWSDSRRAHRIVQMPSTPTDAAIERATSVVFGVYIDGADLHERARASLMEELYSGYGGEDEPELDSRAVFSRMREEACDEFSHFCAALRRSLLELYRETLRTLPVDLLLHNHAFWREIITRARRSVEMRTWDFKQTLDFWSVPEAKRNDAQHKFAEQSAGFANADGGVFFVGFTDDHRRPVGVEKLESRMQQTADVLHRLTPDLRGIVMEAVAVTDGAATVQTLVIVVPQTKAGIAVRDAAGRYSYPQRAQTGLLHLSPDALAQVKASVTNDNFAFLARLRTWSLSA